MQTLTPTAVEITNEGLLTPELACLLEQIEAEVWADLYRAASDDDIRAFGVRLDTIGDATLMMAPCIDVLAFNRAVALGHAAPVTEQVLDAIIAAFREEGAPRFFIQLGPAATSPALHEWLTRRGLRHHNNWAKLFRTTEAPPQESAEVRVEKIGLEDAPAFAQIVATCFDWPDAVQPWVARIVGRPGWHHYLAYDGDTPIAAAALYITGNHGYMGPAATLPAYRGRGAQSALIARRINDAARLSCSLLITETAEDRPDRPAPSFRNMRRHGFQAAYLRPNYICYPGLCP